MENICICVIEWAYRNPCYLTNSSHVSFYQSYHRINQYSSPFHVVCPPLALITARYLLYMEKIRRLIKCIGMLAHCRKDAWSSLDVVDLDLSSLSFLWISSTTCSMVLMSGIRADQDIIVMLFYCSKSIVAVAVCARALPCFKVLFNGVQNVGQHVAVESDRFT